MIVKKLLKSKLLIFTITSYLILLTIKPNVGLSALRNSLYYFKEMIEILPIVFVMISIIEAWIPKEVILKGLGNNSGFKGVGLSFALGSLSAGPLYAAFPLSKLLLNKGASIENIVIILSAWAVIKVPMLVNEMKFLGFDFMIVRWILSVIFILIMAKAIGFTVKDVDVVRGKVEIDSKGIQVKYDYCIGCGLCETILPEYFHIDDGKARLISTEIGDSDRGKLKEIVEKCPVSAVKAK